MELVFRTFQALLEYAVTMLNRSFTYYSAFLSFLMISFQFLYGDRRPLAEYRLHFLYLIIIIH